VTIEALTPGAYAELGWKLFPCHHVKNGICSCGDENCDSPGKHPRVQNGVKAATSNIDQLRAWWQQFPGCNWGLATGQPSGVIAIDIDQRKGGFESFEEYEAGRHAPGDFGATLLAKTGGGGRHIILRAPDAPVKNRVNWLPGVDIRGDGGYVILAPGSHISGGTYAWENWGSPIMSAPEDFLADAAAGAGGSASVIAAGGSMLDPIPEGKRNDTLFRRACSLRRKHNDDRQVVDLIVRTAGRASGVTDREIDVILESAFGQDHSDGAEPAPFSRLNLRGAREVRALPKPTYLIEGVMPEAALFQVFGETGAYKSFVMLDMLASVANGIPWMGREVSAAGPVAFVLGEGGYDAGVRIEAWLLSHPGATDERIVYSIEEQLDLMDEVSVDAILTDLEAYRLVNFPSERWRMIVFDTQADHMPNGDEDKSHDFTVVKRAVQRIAHATGAAVGLVHHTGHNKSRERGSSRQRQALDVVMQIDANHIKNVKQKGAAKFDPIPFTVEPFGDSVAVRAINPVSIAAEGFQAEVESGRAVLAYLAVNPNASQNQLKADLQIGDGTWPGIRDLLESLGYLEVKRDAKGTARSIRATHIGFAWYGIDPEPEA